VRASEEGTGAAGDLRGMAERANTL